MPSPDPRLWSSPLLALAALALAAACEPPPEASCVPGETQACVGASLCDGVQVCAEDGARFEVCACPELDAGPADGGLGADAGPLPEDAGPPADAGPSAGCEGVECGAGECAAAGDGPSCVCDEGYRADGLRCVLDGCPGEDCPRSVAEWQTLFDAEWLRFDQARCTELSESGGAGQEHYFLGYCVDGLVAMWRANGDDRYLDDAFTLIDNTLDDAVLDGEYRHWPGPNDGHTYPLWDSFYWRHVATLVRVLHERPDVRARADYQARYEELLAFTEQHIWSKWRSGGEGNLYRSRTHMASHWARIGMELYEVTGRAEYLEVFENISFGTMPTYPSNLRQQFETNPDVPSAYTWSSVWGNAPTETVQDTSHAGAIISFIVHAEERGHYWTRDDITALRSTLTDVIWTPEMGSNYATNVDGTGGDELSARMHEWVPLGRYDVALQRRIEDDYTGRNLMGFYGTQALGVAALNARILLEGAPVY